MSPIVAPIAPNLLLEILKLYGYKVVSESHYNWVLIYEGRDTPLILGKLGDAVPVEVMENVFEHSSMNDAVYFALKASLPNKDKIH